MVPHETPGSPLSLFLQLSDCSIHCRLPHATDLRHIILNCIGIPWTLELRAIFARQAACYVLDKISISDNGRWIGRTRFIQVLLNIVPTLLSLVQSIQMRESSTTEGLMAVKIPSTTLIYTYTLVHKY